MPARPTIRPDSYTSSVWCPRQLGLASASPNLTNRPTPSCTIVPVYRRPSAGQQRALRHWRAGSQVTPEIRAHRPGDYLCGRRWLTPDHASVSCAVERAGDTHDGCHDLSQIAAQRGAYRDMRADSTSVRSMGDLDDAYAGASSTSPAAVSAGTSAGGAQARWPTESPRIVGLRSGTVLDPKLVAELQAVAARADIAHRVLTILELDRRESRAPEERAQ